MKNIIAIKIHKNDKTVNTIESIVRFRNSLRTSLGEDFVVVCIPDDELTLEKVTGDFKLISVDGIDYTVDDIMKMIENTSIDS